MNQEKIFAIIVIGLVGGGFSIALAGSNYFEEFADSDVKDAAHILIDGYNIGNFNIDEALTQRFFIEGMEKPYDVVILGSSRAMQIYNHNFPHMTMVNHGISKGNTEDMIAYTQLYHERNKLPTIVMIGVDPWMLEFEVPNHVLEDAYVRGMQNIGNVKPNTNERFYETNIMPYFQNLDFIRHGLRLNNLRVIFGLNPSHYATSERVGVSPFKLIDGWSYPISRQEEAREEENVNALVRERKINTYGVQIPFNPEEVKRFEVYIEYLLKEDVTLILFCSPYHPMAYSKFEEEITYINSLNEISEYLREFSNKNNILLIGSYNPHTYDLTSIDFYDGYHPKPYTIAKIISAHSHELYDLLYTEIYPTYEEYATALAESQAELFT